MRESDGGHLQSPGEATAPCPQRPGTAEAPHVLQGQVGPACRMGLDREGASTGEPVRERLGELRVQRSSCAFGFRDRREDGHTTPLIYEKFDTTLHRQPLATMDMLPREDLRPGARGECMVYINLDRKQTGNSAILLKVSLRLLIRISNYYQLLSLSVLVLTFINVLVVDYYSQSVCKEPKTQGSKDLTPGGSHPNGAERKCRNGAGAAVTAQQRTTATQTMGSHLSRAPGPRASAW